MMNAERHSVLPRWRILIVDDEAKTRQDHCENLRYEQDGRYDLFFAGEQGQQGRDLLNDAKYKARKHRCHLALVDMRLLDNRDRTDTSGLDLVNELKPTESIIVTGFADKARYSEEARKKGALHVLDKGDPAELRNLVRETLEECGYRDIVISWQTTLNELRIARHLFPENPSQFRSEAEDVLRRLFARVRVEGLIVAPLDTVDNLLSLTLRPGSLVIKVTEAGKDLPHLVKIGRSNRIGTEVTNYNDHIRKRGPSEAPVAPLQTCHLWSLGGTVYNYVGNFSDQHPTLFSDWYKASDRDLKEIEEVLQALYRQWRRHYHQRCPETSTAVVIYSEVWDRNKEGEKWLAKLMNRRHLYSGLKVPPLLSRLSLPDPVDWLITKLSIAPDGTFKDPSAQSANISITHGDMHGDNFFVIRPSGVWMIDYERTGKGHVLQDWVELEHDILTRLTLLQPEEWSDYVYLVSGIAQPNVVSGWSETELQALCQKLRNHQAQKALKVINIIRRLAKDSEEGSGDARPYVWGLLLNAVFRMMIWCKEYDEPKLPEEDVDKYTERRQKLHQGIKRCFVLAAILCHRLDNWNKNWPPKEWESMLKDSASATSTQFTPVSPGAQRSTLVSRKFALLIGVGNTPNDPLSSLPTTVKDVLALQSILVDPTTCAYPAENVRILHNETATLLHITNGLKWLADQAIAYPDSTSIIYFSGHGGHLQVDDRYFLVSSDFDPTNIEGSVLWASEFSKSLRKIEAKRLLVLIDACHAAEMATAKATSQLEESGFVMAPPSASLLKTWQQSSRVEQVKHNIKAPERGEGRVVISSSRGDQSSYVRKDGTLSIFTYHLLEALRGDANKPGDTSVAISTVIGHLSKNVPEGAQHDWNRTQVPWADFTGEDFQVAAIRGAADNVPTNLKPTICTAPLNLDT